MRAQSHHDPRIDGVLLPVSFTSTMAAAVPHVATALIGTAARRALGGITDRLPAALTRRAYLECRLAEMDSRVDLVICVDRSSRTLLMNLQGAWLPIQLRTHPMWTGLERLCAEWADPRSPIGAAMYDLWLEFDAEEPPPAGDVLIPSVFVGSMRSVTSTAAQVWSAALGCLETLMDRALDPDVIAAAQHAVGTLPAGANIPYVGMMYPRSRQAIRLCLAPLSGKALLNYLETMAWPGEIGELEAFLRSIPYGRDTTALDCTTRLHIDLLDGVQPRIGLEIPLPQYPRAIDGAAERDLLDALCDRQLCATAKRDALLRWPGYGVERFRHQCWPSVAIRRVSHLKIVCEPGRRTQVKTYLSFFHDFLNLRSRSRVNADKWRLMPTNEEIL